MGLGGLHIVGTERHESRRIDNQLRGRGGRQGDPGSSIFYLSLEDDLMRIFGSERIQGLMKAMGMKEGEQIEHPWLTKAIANAQKKVEAHNFDIRKNLLEYDDVMNQQRRSIYKLRRMVLGFGAGVPVVEYDEDPKTRKKIRREQVYQWPDARDHMLDLIEDLVVEMVGAACGPRMAEWDLDGLAAVVQDQFGVGMKFAPPGGRAADARRALEEQVFNVVEKLYRQKEEELGKDAEGVPVLRRYEQYLYLQAIDQQWKDHLLSMDHLRQGIGLRGYGQKDPKQEYKKEGYEMFVQMTWRVKSAVVGNILRLQLVRQESAEEIEAKRLAHAAPGHGPGHGQPRRRGWRRRAKPRREAGDGGPHAAQGRPERPVPVRLGQEVQEVPRGDRDGGIAPNPHPNPSANPAGRARVPDPVIRGPDLAAPRVTGQGTRGAETRARRGRARVRVRAGVRGVAPRTPPAPARTAHPEPARGHVEADVGALVGEAIAEAGAAGDLGVVEPHRMERAAPRPPAPRRPSRRSATRGASAAPPERPSTRLSRYRPSRMPRRKRVLPRRGRIVNGTWPLAALRRRAAPAPGRAPAARSAAAPARHGEGAVSGSSPPRRTRTRPGPATRARARRSRPGCPRWRTGRRGQPAGAAGAGDRPGCRAGRPAPCR